MDRIEGTELADPQHTTDLTPAERQLLRTAQQIWFGRIEQITLQDGQPVRLELARTIHSVKLDTSTTIPEISEEFSLRNEARRLIATVRATRSGHITRLEIRHGIPILVEIEMGHSGLVADAGDRHA